MIVNKKEYGQSKGKRGERMEKWHSFGGIFTPSGSGSWHPLNATPTLGGFAINGVFGKQNGKTFCGTQSLLLHNFQGSRERERVWQTS